MRTTARELVGLRTREAVRDHMSDTVLRDIDEMWMDELFPEAPKDLLPAGNGGQRVTRFQGYLDQVDWTSPSQVARAVRVFEVALRPLFDHPWAPDWDTSTHIARLRKLFARDNYTLHDEGHITGGETVNLDHEYLGDLRSAEVIFEHLRRIEEATVRNDPALAIGSAKELVESTAKIVLRERGKNFDKNDDLPKLAGMASDALSIHPKQTAADNQPSIRKILGGALAISGGIAELRNTHGTGHGRDAPPSGLNRRHARLAVNGARLWCQFVLDTLADTNAPWKKIEDD